MLESSADPVDVPPVEPVEPSAVLFELVELVELVEMFELESAVPVEPAGIVAGPTPKLVAVVSAGPQDSAASRERAAPSFMARFAENSAGCRPIGRSMVNPYHTEPAIGTRTPGGPSTALGSPGCAAIHPHRLFGSLPLRTLMTRHCSRRCLKSRPWAEQSVAMAAH